MPILRIALVALMPILIANTKAKCSYIKETLNIAKPVDCSNLYLCVGYAKCEDQGKEYAVKILCSAKSSETCPNVEDCVAETKGEKLFRSYQLASNGSMSGSLQVCGSDTMKDRNQKVDAIYSKFCGNQNGVFEKSDEPVSEQTAVTGGGAQTGTSKGYVVPTDLVSRRTDLGNLPRIPRRRWTGDGPVAN